MSREGGGPNGSDDGEDVATEDDWPPFEEDQGDRSDWNLEERQQELERKEEVLKRKEEELRNRERELNKRKRDLDNREQEVLERREEIVEERERLEEMESELEGRETEIQEQASQLEGREQEIESLSEKIDEKLSEAGGGGGQRFSKRPLRAGGTLLGILGVFSVLGAFLIFLSGGYLTALTSSINSATGAGIDANLFESSFATGLAVIMLLAAMVEFVAGVFAIRGQFWMFTVAAAIIGMMIFIPVGIVFVLNDFLLPGLLAIVFLLPLGIAATFFLGVGEGRFR